MVTSPYYNHEILCPVCKLKFTTTRVRSSACYVVARETDFHTKYRDIDPLLYSIWVCPNCQYANTDQEFKKDLKPQELDRLKAELPKLQTAEPDFSRERTVQVALRAILLAIRSAIIRQAPSIAQAGLFLRAAWLYRGLNQTDDEMKFLQKALLLYEYSFEKESNEYTQKMGEARMMYMIGELNRRLGNYDNAVLWLGRIINNRKMNVEPDLRRLIKDQWEVTREEHKNQLSGKTADRPLQDPMTVTGETLESTAPQPAENSGSSPVKSIPHKNRGSKAKMFVSFYMDQVEWVKSIANSVSDKHGVFMEKETIIRAIVDAVMEKYPEPGDFKTEEEFKNTLLEKFSGN